MTKTINSPEVVQSAAGLTDVSAELDVLFRQDDRDDLTLSHEVSAFLDLNDDLIDGHITSTGRILRSVVEGEVDDGINSKLQ